MGDKFIYVFNQDAKQKMLDAGFKLMVANDDICVFTFLNDKTINMEDIDVSYIMSDRLTF